MSGDQSMASALRTSCSARDQRLDNSSYKSGFKKGREKSVTWKWQIGGRKHEQMGSDATNWIWIINIVLTVHSALKQATD